MASQPPEEAANRLVVKEATTMDDNSLCGIHRATMERLSLFTGDVVLLKTELGRTTACAAVEDSTCEDHALRINRVVRSNLRVRVADVVSVHPCDDIRDGRRVHVLPVDDTVEGVTGDLFGPYLMPYFKDARRPVHKGDRFLVRGGTGTGTRSVEFKVVEIDSPAVEFCLVSNSTEICCHGEPVRREEDEERLDDVGYGDVGGGGMQADDLERRAGRATTHAAPIFRAYSHEAMKRGEYCAIRWIWH